MKKWNVKKILTVISIIIICLGILAGIEICIELINTAPIGEKFIVDGSDFSGLVDIGVIMMSILMRLGNGIL